MADHWWNAAAAAFEVWLSSQTDEVQNMELLDQIELYAAAHNGGARG